MNDRNRKSAGACAVVCAGLALSLFNEPARARAEFIGNQVTVDVSTGADSGEWSLNVPASSDFFTWTLVDPVPIMGEVNGEVLATLSALTVTLDGDPQAFVFFAVVAGGAPTNVSVTSSVVAFSPLINPGADASAQLGVTDLTANGASATGNFAGGTKSFQARYNGGTTYANLVDNVSTPSGSASDSENFGPLPIAGAVSSIQVQFDFVLSAGDLGTGSGAFNVVPEPSSVVLAILGFMGLMCWARRRRRK